MSDYTPLRVAESSIQDVEALWLYERAKEMDSIVELGCFQGKSSHALLSGCRGQVFCIDHFKGSTDVNDATHGKSGKKEFLSNCGEFAHLRLIELDTVLAADLFADKTIDMIFIDAGHLHNEVLADLTAWAPKCKKLLCGHDFTHPSVRQALIDRNYDATVACATIWEVRL